MTRSILALLMVSIFSNRSVCGIVDGTAYVAAYVIGLVAINAGDAGGTTLVTHLLGGIM